MNKQLPIIYKRTQTGAEQQWQIFVEDNSFYTIEGQVNGTLTTSKPTIVSGKNIGKTNETTDNEQAYAEAKAKWQKKIDKGYTEDISKLLNDIVNTGGFDLYKNSQKYNL